MSAIFEFGKNYLNNCRVWNTCQIVVYRPLPRVNKESTADDGPESFPWYPCKGRERPTAPGDVPRTRPVNERCVTDCGGDAEFMKESFARDMLYSSMASKIRADVDATRTGGMFF